MGTKQPPRVYKKVRSNRHGRIEQADDGTTRIVWYDPPTHRPGVVYVYNLGAKADRVDYAATKLDKGPLLA